MTMTAEFIVIVHHLAQAKSVVRIADELIFKVQLRSAPGAAASAGVGYLKALGDEVGHSLVIDCDDDPGLAMAALRAGSKQLLFAGPAKLQLRIGQMAERCGGRVQHPDETSLMTIDLSPDDDEHDIRSKLTASARS
ncbi:MAG: hypothetical protein AAFO01_21535 [Pseudomonadota bacterium]